jgi:hypothetical protein
VAAPSDNRFAPSVPILAADVGHEGDISPIVKAMAGWAAEARMDQRGARSHRSFSRHEAKGPSSLLGHAVRASGATRHPVEADVDNVGPTLLCLPLCCASRETSLY